MLVRRRSILGKVLQGRPFHMLCTRWVAKNLVAAGLADRCELQVLMMVLLSRFHFCKLFLNWQKDDEELAEIVRDTLT